MLFASTEAFVTVDLDPPNHSLYLFWIRLLALGIFNTEGKNNNNNNTIYHNSLFITSELCQSSLFLC